VKSIIIHNKKFELAIPASIIEKEVNRISNELNRDLNGKTPVFLSILNGSFMFTSDLVKQFHSNCEVSFVKLTSYQGNQSSGNVQQIIGLNNDLKNRVVVVIEDIVDTGTTLFHFLKEIEKMQPTEVKVAAMFYKPLACKHPIKIDYLGIEVPNDFIIGYGLDYNGLGRNFNDLYKLSE
jgi:hypoxanthine phosphoribosyltransferase